MLDQVLDLFEIRPDYDLNLMRQSQNLSDLTCNILQHLKPVLQDFSPDLVLVHGDTTTTFAASLAAYYEKISVGHIEAGLRTRNIYSPWPEEINRHLTSVIARYHFSPTESSKKNLINEGINEKLIIVTGNTVIDSLFYIVKELASNFNLKQEMDKKFNYLNPENRLILVTGHRRESFGNDFDSICEALKSIASLNSKVDIVYPVHLNPKIRIPVMHKLSSIKNIHLIEPQDYIPFVYLMNRSFIIITDSGGVQEEGPSLGKPVLVIRNTTERPEAIIAGTVKLVGTDSEKIIFEVSKLLSDYSAYQLMSKAHNPYGDGLAASRIVQSLKLDLLN
jgi:UDP-N-acetylglucosamine 2-epimerase (non-hydrolysing)